MTIHKLTERENKAMLKLSNVIYDQLANDLDLSEERTDALTRAAISTMERWLEEGK